MIRERRRPRFVAPVPPAEVVLKDFTSGQNTEALESEVTVRKGRNVRFGSSVGFRTRPGQIQVGNTIGTSGGITGLFSYVRSDRTKELLASWGTDIYRYTETSSPASVATSTAAQATGYGKDRHAAFTSATDANGYPYLVVTYQSGSGIVLEWASHPYATWSNSPVTIDSTTQVGWSLVKDASDDLHVAFMSDANTTRYVRLAYSAGPSWSVGTKVTVAGSGSSDRAYNPTVARQPGGRLHVGYASYDGSQYVNKVRLSEDAGATWSSPVTLGTPGSAATYAIAATVIGDAPYFVIQEDVTGAGTAYGYNQFVYNSSYLYQSYLGYGGTQTLNQFSLVPDATGVKLSYASGAAPEGISSVTFGAGTAANRRNFSVVTDGVNDTDIQYRNVVNGTEDAAATRVSNDSSQNRYPSAPESVMASASYVPVMFVTGTGSPYAVKVNAQAQYVSLSATLTAGRRAFSAVMPKTAAGGTDYLYVVNGAQAYRWTGSALSAASATGFPTGARHAVAFDGRLWFFGGISDNRAAYTDLGADNWTGTFPGGNTLDFPYYLQGGIVYRDQAMLVFTDRKQYLVQNFDYSGAAAGPENVRLVPNSHGTLSMATVQQIGYWVYYQAEDGTVRRTNGNQDEDVSGNIRPDIAALSLSQLRNAAAGVSGDLYKLSVTGSASGSNNLVYVLDTKTGAWSIDTGQSVSVFAVHPDQNDVPRLFAGDVSQGAVYQNETGDTDNGADITMRLETGLFTFGSLLTLKTLRGTVVAAETADDATLSVGLATATNTSSFSVQPVSLLSGGRKWGIGKWGDGGTWGVNTNVYDYLSWGRHSQGFKLSFEATGPVQVNSVSLLYEIIRSTL